MDTSNTFLIPRWVATKEFWKCLVTNSVWAGESADRKVWCGGCAKTHEKKEMTECSAQDFFDDLKKSLK